MNKTKRIDVWINSSNFENNRSYTSIHWSKKEADDFLEKDDIQYIGELVIEIPEQKITITESELDKAWRKVFNSYNTADHFKIKKALGFKND